MGLLGDSYYGITSNIPSLSKLYTSGFQIFSYTRNGIFLTPIFLALGGWIAQEQHHRSFIANIIGFTAFMFIMLAEGMLLHIHGIPRHDSMYVFLLPCMYFLFCGLLQCSGYTTWPVLKKASMYIYILHPLLTVVIRGSVKLIGLNDLLVNNNMIHFFAVSLLSILLSTAIIKINKVGDLNT